MINYKKINNWKSKINEDAQENERLKEYNSKCYKYELLFNFRAEISATELDRIQKVLDKAFKDLIELDNKLNVLE